MRLPGGNDGTCRFLALFSIKARDPARSSFKLTAQNSEAHGMFKDMVKDLAMRVFLIHLAAFIAGTLICAAVNFWLTPDTLWFPWVLIGWEIGRAHV